MSLGRRTERVLEYCSIVCNSAGRSVGITLESGVSGVQCDIGGTILFSYVTHSPKTSYFYAISTPNIFRKLTSA